ncbi:MAG: ABC transporter permease [Chloroflexi bacterium]|nr:ABC transporter permease [Chloroflexota bacterium]
MLAYTLRRFLALIPVLAGVSVIVFLFLHLIPGDPAEAMLGDRATAENAARLRTAYGLDQPWSVQYALYMGKVLQGDLGRSVRSSNPVSAELAQRFPATAELALAAMLLAIGIGVPAGIISATRRGSAFDHGSMVLALAGVSMPIFWLGLMLAWFFGVQLKWLPFSARLDTGTRYVPLTGLLVIDSIVRGDWGLLVQTVRHLALPAIALSTVPMAIIARMTRGAMLEVLQLDFVRTAHAKGLRDFSVIARHALKNAMLPVVTVIGLQVGALLSGAILTETIFSWPGIGRWIYESIQFRDYPVVQSMTLFVAAIVVVTNLLVDLSYAALDPRVRYR